MTENQEDRQGDQSLLVSLDPVWLKHRELIENVAEKIRTPKTLEGENIRKLILLKSPVVRAYPRLGEILDSLISLIEFDEIGKYTNNDFFSDPMIQMIVTRALGLRLEDIVKDPYSSDEGKKYDDYRPFFEGLLRGLKNFSEKSEEGNNLNFIDELVSLTAQEINKLKAVKNFRINTDTIRSRIRNYLPKLQQLDNGKILSEIMEQIKKCLSPQSNQ